MSKKLVLAEKPSVGRDIARVMGCHKGGNGYFEGDKYIVTWALGHLVTLADPEVYDKKYATWKIEDLPMLPTPLKLVTIKQTGKQYHTVSELLGRKDVDEVIIATDAGREGELVARWILEKAKVRKPIKRLWISSVTDKAIKEGFAQLRDGRLYENLYASAVARSEADWYVGINATRALTCKFNAQLSCGRVQTPTLAMINGREKEIQGFTPKAYFGLQATVPGFKLTWFDKKNNSSQTYDETRIPEITKALQGKEGKISSVEKSLKKSFSPGLYDLTELQRDANKMFSYSAKDTLNIMQALYERHKILTYPRTDSRFLSTDILPTIKDRLKACGVGPYAATALKLSIGKIQENKSFVDNSKVSDHHAIIPTEQPVVLSALSNEERKIYDLVVKRFIAVLLPPFEYEQTTIIADIGGESFKAKGKIVKVNGWKEIYSGISDEEASEDGMSEQLLPNLNKGDSLKVSSLTPTKGFTNPPQYFTEGTLLTAMEQPAKYMSDSDKDLIKIIGETGGIGTVATRADIIEKLANSFVIEKKGKYLHITPKGKQLLELVPTELKSPALTAQWEKKLEMIAKGTLKKDVFIGDMKAYAQKAVTMINSSTSVFKHDNVTREKCPDCGKFLLEVAGKKGKMLVCPDRECGHRQGVSRVTNARCPVCHKKLELRGSGDAQIFVCSCGHREKLSSFNNRRKDDTGKADKRDVQAYLANQGKKEEKVDLANSPFAALAKLKL